MSSNRNLGPVQIHDLSVASINAAFLELMSRSDEQRGLRGRALVHDQQRVSSPSLSSDAVDLGSLNDREALFHITLVGPPGIVAAPASTSYTEIAAALRQQINFATPVSLAARLIISGFGTEASLGKGIALTDPDGTVISEVLWDGNGEGIQVGSFTTITVSADTLTQLHAKGSTETESIVITTAAIEFRFSSGQST